MLSDAGEPSTFAVQDGPYPFRSVDGTGVYEIPVGPVHAGMIGPGHFRFSVVGETILDLKARLWFVHRGIERLFQGRRPDAGIELAERVSGETWFYRIKDPDEQVRVARDFIRNLAALHRLDPAALDLPSFAKVASCRDTAPFLSSAAVREAVTRARSVSALPCARFACACSSDACTCWMVARACAICSGTNSSSVLRTA